MYLSFETVLYHISSIFLLPALALIMAALVYALFALGGALIEGAMRRRGTRRSALLAYYRETSADSDDLELWILRRLELLRLSARVTPMLGLVATLIPMGPALLALTQNEAAEMAQNMVVAFAGVTLALVAASIAFLVLNVRRRWLLEDLREIERHHMAPASPAPTPVMEAA